MATHPSPVVGSDVPSSHLPRARSIWALWAAALLVGVGAGTAVAVAVRGHAHARTPAAAPPLHDIATWKAGVRRAPDFRLAYQNGTRFSLGDLRGRPVIVTFVDPLCRDLCPLEAKILGEAVARLPAARRPAIVAVSVDPWGDSKTAFAEDRVRWRLPSSWRWGVGTAAELRPVWKDYAIGVRTTKRTIAGVTVRRVDHSEASYVVDGSGYERALLVYPFRVADVLATLRRLGGRGDRPVPGRESAAQPEASRPAPAAGS
jgi:cytochrome oxidase Cu insertion factor (SCO1/SenC/PrrC family)